MMVLVINCGSSSLKFALFEGADAAPVLRGSIAIAAPDSGGRGLERTTASGAAADAKNASATDSADAVARLLERLRRDGLASPDAIGHRIVHGGQRFTDAIVVDDAHLRDLEALDALAPLHNPAARRALQVTRAAFPGVPEVAVFDTAFHATLPDHAQRYALPAELSTDLGIRRYGFHGTSHRYLAARAAELLDRPLGELRLVTLHLGHGASLAAIRGGRCVDTSMGFTPLEGLVMGTRCGDLDASVPLFLQMRHGFSASDVETLLNERSGLVGVAGESDMRVIEERRKNGDAAAALAFDMFCYRARKYLGAYIAVLGGIDAVVFAGGIGERSAAVRAAVCADLAPLGIVLDEHSNVRSEPDAFVHAPASRAAVAVIATDEEYEIATQVLALLADSEGTSLDSLT